MTTPWYVIQVRPSAEKRVAEALKEHGIEGYYPVEKVWRGIGDRRRKHERPLIRGYVFASLPHAAFPMLHDIEGYQRLVRFSGGDSPAVVPQRIIERIRAAEGAGRYDLTRDTRPGKGAPRNVGDRAKIGSGHPLAGFEVAIVGLSSERRVEVMLAMMSSEKPTTIDLADLEDVEEPEPAKEAA